MWGTRNAVPPAAAFSTPLSHQPSSPCSSPSRRCPLIKNPSTSPIEFVRWLFLFQLIRRPDQLCHRMALLVAVHEQLRANHALLVDQQSAGIGNPIQVHLPDFLSGGLFVLERVSDDGLALGVGEQWKRDFPLVGKPL